MAAKEVIRVNTNLCLKKCYFQYNGFKISFMITLVMSNVDIERMILLHIFFVKNKYL